MSTNPHHFMLYLNRVRICTDPLIPIFPPNIPIPTLHTTQTPASTLSTNREATVTFTSIHGPNAVLTKNKKESEMLVMKRKVLKTNEDQRSEEAEKEILEGNRREEMVRERGFMLFMEVMEREKVELEGKVKEEVSTSEKDGEK